VVVGGSAWVVMCVGSNPLPLGWCVLHKEGHTNHRGLLPATHNNPSPATYTHPLHLTCLSVGSKFLFGDIRRTPSVCSISLRCRCIGGVEDAIDAMDSGLPLPSQQVLTGSEGGGVTDC